MRQFHFFFGIDHKKKVLNLKPNLRNLLIKSLILNAVRNEFLKKKYILYCFLNCFFFVKRLIFLNLDVNFNHFKNFPNFLFEILINLRFNFILDLFLRL